MGILLRDLLAAVPGTPSCTEAKQPAGGGKDLRPTAYVWDAPSTEVKLWEIGEPAPPPGQ
jgi:hypothetical protein